MKKLKHMAGLALLSASLLANAETPGPQASATGETGVIVIIGASYANAWPVTRIGNLPVVNAGVGGNQTRDMLARFETDVLARNPSHVLIWGFINDYSRSSRDKYAEAARGVEANFRQMVDLAQARGIKVSLATEVTMPASATWHGNLLATVYRSLGRESFADRVNREVMNSNVWLKSFAAERGLPVVDLQSALSPKGFYRDRRFTQPDGSHLNEAAYGALTAYVDSKQDVVSR